ncbi:MAG: hypothetical protein HOO91_00475 [Bacteroidales bacterium]|nr:hypothetical protein [Bacteroidales bacterium]
MAYRKRATSVELEKAQNRLAGMKLFETTINFGRGLTEADYTTKIDEVNTLTQSYNTLLTQADAVATQLDIAERELAELSKRFINVVGAKYGFDSVEFEKVGGLRMSDYRRSSKKVATTSTNNQHT